VLNEGEMMCSNQRQVGVTAASRKDGTTSVLHFSERGALGLGTRIGPFLHSDNGPGGLLISTKLSPHTTSSHQYVLQETTLSQGLFLLL
jgi:hypothetical protein